MRDETKEFARTHHLILGYFREEAKVRYGRGSLGLIHAHLHPDFDPDVCDFPNAVPAARVIDVLRFPSEGPHPIAAVEQFLFFTNIHLAPLQGAFRYAYSDGYTDELDAYPVMMFYQPSYSLEVAPQYTLTYRTPRIL